MTEVSNTRQLAIFALLWDVIKMRTIYQQHRRCVTGIVGAALGLGVVHFVRKWGNKLRHVNAYGVRARRDRIAVVTSFEECEIAVECLKRLVVLCRLH